MIAFILNAMFRLILFIAACPALLGAGPAHAGAPIDPQIDAAARAALAPRLAQFADPVLALTLAQPRALERCGSPLEVTPAEVRSPLRMRFHVRCSALPGWQVQATVAARITARVAVLAGPVAAGQSLRTSDVRTELREVSAIPDALLTADSVLGRSARRSLRAGEVLRSTQLRDALLVRRSTPVVMLARGNGVEASTSGEALDEGALGTVVRVRHGNGRVLRMRVIGENMVEPFTR